MTFCTESRSRQWTLWLCAAGVALMAYVSLSYLLCGSVSFDVLEPCRYRLAVSLLVLLGIFVWETRWDGIWRDEDDFMPFPADSEGEGPKGVSTASVRHPPVAPSSVVLSAAEDDPFTLVKLGEQAMRRETWVEAYYWMWQARRNGRPDLEAQLCEIRESWMLDGFSDEATNVSGLFTVEKGSIGRALLHLDTRRDAEGAREFLRTNYPDLLSE